MKQGEEPSQSEQGVIEEIALKLIERRKNQQTYLWSYLPSELKSKGRRKTKKEVARRRAKQQLSRVAYNRIINTMHELSAAEYERLVSRAVDLLFENGWMEIINDTQVKMVVDKSSRSEKGRYPRVQRREHRLVVVVTGVGTAALGRWKAVKSGHPSTGNIATIRKADQA